MGIQDNRKKTIDELAITKAAAWAWYERGSWFEQESIRETDCRRPRTFAPRPSRYKLEAMKNLQKENQDSECNNISNQLLGSSEHFDNSLLDIYQIERISWEFGGHVESSKAEHRRHKVVDDGDHGGRRVMPEETKSKISGKKKHAGRFWMRYGIACGSSRDSVAEHAILTGGRRREKVDLPVIGAMNFRVPTNHGRFTRL